MKLPPLLYLAPRTPDEAVSGHPDHGEGLAGVYALETGIGSRMGNQEIPKVIRAAIDEAVR